MVVLMMIRSFRTKRKCPESKDMKSGEKYFLVEEGKGFV